MVADSPMTRGRRRMLALAGGSAMLPLLVPRAVQAPLVVLGEPGSGKSKLTEVLAARLGECVGDTPAARQAGADAAELRALLAARPGSTPAEWVLEHLSR